MLNEKQKEALKAVKKGQNVFITGGAGVGKTYLIKCIVQEMWKHKKEYSIVAPTGVAALQINGETIHRYFCLPVYCDQMQTFEVPDRINEDKMKGKREQIRGLEVLIVDEVSMIHKNVFRMMDSVVRYIKQKETPFGGLQVVLIGDFYQLCPITETEENVFIFGSSIWEKLNLTKFVLLEPHRQNVRDFDILTKIRHGQVSKEDLNECLIDRMSMKELAHNYADWTILFTTNKMKDHYNHMMNSFLNTPIQKFDAVVWGAPLALPDPRSEATKSTPSGTKTKGKGIQAFNHVPDVLELRIGSRVMITYNIHKSLLVNGDVGIVKGFDKKGFPIVYMNRLVKAYTIKREAWKCYAFQPSSVENEKGKWVVIGGKSQIPLTLGWAFTVHKVQGLTLDKVVVDLSKCFSPGQAYVALSRCRSLESLKIMNYDDSQIVVSKFALEYQ